MIYKGNPANFLQAIKHTAENTFKTDDCYIVTNTSLLFGIGADITKQ